MDSVSETKPAPPDCLPGDVVQITDRQDSWFPCLMIVDSVRSWGIQAYTIVPDGGKTRQALYRVSNGKFERIGVAAMVAGDVARARDKAIETERILKQEGEP